MKHKINTPSILNGKNIANASVLALVSFVSFHAMMILNDSSIEQDEHIEESLVPKTLPPLYTLHPLYLGEMPSKLYAASFDDRFLATFLQLENCASATLPNYCQMSLPGVTDSFTFGKGDFYDFRQVPIAYGGIEGYRVFCEENKDDSICQDSYPEGDDFIKDEQRPFVKEVNARVNNAIKYTSDAQFGNKRKDVWVKYMMPPAKKKVISTKVKGVKVDVVQNIIQRNIFKGDCEDYVLTKIGELQKQDPPVPLRAMKTLFVTYEGEEDGHMLLAVKTKKGTYLILDNGSDNTVVEVANLVDGVENNPAFFHKGKKITKLLVSSPTVPYQMVYATKYNAMAIVSSVQGIELKGTVRD